MQSLCILLTLSKFAIMVQSDHKQKSVETKVKKDRSTYIYYSGLGFQMIATIGLFSYIGYRIDQSKSGEAGLYTALFALGGVFVSLISTIRSVMKKR